MSDKKVTSTKQSVDTKIETRSDGAVVKTITTTTVEQYEDGSTSTETSIKIITDKAPTKQVKEPVRPASTTDVGTETYKNRHSKNSEVQNSFANLAIEKKRKTGDESSKRVPENKSVATRVHKVSSTDFAMQALNAHNLYRKNHNVPSLVLSDALCKQAQIWANKLVDEDDKSNGNVKSFYSKSSDGESVHYWPNPLATGKNIVDDWYSQIKQYDFDCPSHNNTSYFAQMVWKSTKELGFAKAQCKRGGIYIVANYRPRWGSGNFHENIPKPNKAWGYFDALNKAELPRCVVTTERKFLTDALKAFNDCRKKHRTPLVFLSDDLCELAQMQANKIAAKNSMESSDVPFTDYYGETRFWSSSSEVNGDSAVEKWYAGVEKYKFESALDFQNDTGNFTQVVWKGTKEVGIAKAMSGKNETYVVAIYNPSGNVKGEFSSNVLNPWSQTPIAKLINSFQHK